MKNCSGIFVIWPHWSLNYNFSFSFKANLDNSASEIAVHILFYFLRICVFSVLCLMIEISFYLLPEISNI
jgi:hypothetical protein